MTSAAPRRPLLKLAPPPAPLHHGKARITPAGYGLLIGLGFTLLWVALGLAFAWGQGWRP